MQSRPSTSAAGFRRAAAIALAVLATLSLTGAAAFAVPTLDEVAADFGLGNDDVQRVRNGEFVTGDVKTVSDRDLSLSIAFLLKTPPDVLAKQIVAGKLVKDDSWSAIRKPACPGCSKPSGG